MTTTPSQTLAEAIAEVRAGRMPVHRAGLDGCQVGPSPQTQEAKWAIINMVPVIDLRSYSVFDLIDSLYYSDKGCYRRRDDADVQGGGR